MKKVLIISLMIICMLLVGCNQAVKSDQPYIITYKEDYDGFKSMDPYDVEFEETIISAISDKIDEIEKAKREEIVKEYDETKDVDFSKIKNNKYDIIFLDDDNIPELVVSDDETWIELYNYDGKKYKIIGEKFVLGTDGNQAYEYIPKSGIVYNVKSSYGRMIHYYQFKKLNSNSKFEDLYTNELYDLHFEDINGNKIPDEGEDYSIETHNYFFGDKSLDEEKFLEYKLSEEVYENLYGTKSKDDMKKALEGLKK